MSSVHRIVTSPLNSDESLEYLNSWWHCRVTPGKNIEYKCDARHHQFRSRYKAVNSTVSNVDAMIEYVRTKNWSKYDYDASSALSETIAGDNLCFIQSQTTPRTLLHADDLWVLENAAAALRAPAKKLQFTALEDKELELHLLTRTLLN